jgi:hypothetical protein
MSSDYSFSKCAACTRRGQPCLHSQSSLRSWTSVVEGQEQLDTQIQVVEKQFESALTALRESSARLKTLRSRRQLLKERGDTMLAQ